MTDGCPYGKVSREMILNIKESLDRIEKSNKEMFNHFTDRYEQMFEKLRNRVPVWVTVILSLFCMLLSAMGVYILTK